MKADTGYRREKELRRKEDQYIVVKWLGVAKIKIVRGIFHNGFT